MLQCLVSNRIIKKSEEIKVFKRNETESKIYFLARYCGKDGIHEYEVSFRKNNNIPIWERLDCTCKFCSLNVIDARLCSYKLACIVWLANHGYLNKEYIKTILKDGFM